MLQETDKFKIGCINTRKSASPRRLVTLAKRLKYDLIILVDVNPTRPHTIANTISVHQDTDFSIAIVVINTNISYKVNYMDKHIIHLTINELKLNLVAYYLRPNNSADVAVTDHKISQLITSIKGESIFTGDLNAHHQVFNDPTDGRGSSYLSIIQSAGYVLINDPTEHTYECTVGSATPDWTFCTSKTANNTVWSIDDAFDGYSDHRLVSLTITTEQHIVMTSEIVYTSSRKFLRKIQEYSSTDDLEHWYDHLTRALTESQYLGSTDTKVDFWDEKLKSEKKLITSLIKQKRIMQYTATAEEFNDIKLKIKTLSASHKKCVTIAKENFYLQKLRDADSTTVFREVVAPLKTRARHNVDHLMINNERTHDTSVIAEEIMSHFYPASDIPAECFDDIDTCNVTDHTITDREVATAITEIKVRKAPGENRLGSELIKKWYAADPVYLNCLIRYWYEAGIFPQQFRTSLIIPIIKNTKNPLTTSNLRPIGLLCHMGKLYERVIKNRLMHHALTNNVIGDEQCGYLSGRSTEDALYRLQSRRKRNASLSVTPAEVMASFDIKSAFDSISQRSIVQSVADMGVPNTMLSVIKQYFTERKAKLIVGNYTAIRYMNRGIVQGGCISPFLWSLTFEKVIKRIREKSLHCGAMVTIAAFADDISLIITSPNDLMKALYALQILVEELVMAAAELNLKISINKTQLMITNKAKVNMKISLMNETLGFQDHLKILGVYFSRNNRFTHHLEQRLKCAKDKFSVLAFTLRRKDGLHHRVKEQLLTSIIYPTISYACVIWYKKNEHWHTLRNYFRHIIILTSRCFRTVSHMSVLILTRIPPLHYYIDFQQNYCTKYRQGTIASHRKYDSPPRVNEYPPPNERELVPIAGYIHTSVPVPTDANVQIFTDGSKFNNEDRCPGAAFVVFNNAQEIYTRMLKLPKHASVYTTELVAINEAVNYVVQSDYASAAIFSDSQAAVFAAASDRSTNCLALKTHLDLVEARRSKNIDLYWIKAHVGHQGNERADDLAKNATVQGQPYDTLKPVSLLKARLKNKMRQAIDNEYQANQWGRTIKLFVPSYNSPLKKNLIINDYTILLYTGHCSTRSYLHERKKISSPLCPCGKIQDVKHILTDCPIFVEENVHTASSAKLRPQDLFGPWEDLIKIKKLHSYIRLRAKRLVTQLRDMNEIQNDTTQVDNSVSVEQPVSEELQGSSTQNLSDIVDEDEEYDLMLKRVISTETAGSASKRARLIVSTSPVRDNTHTDTSNKRQKTTDTPVQK